MKDYAKQILIDMLEIYSPSGEEEELSNFILDKTKEFGFFAEKDPLNAPLETNVEGIYLCGGATGPIDISESVIQAIAASGKASQPRWFDGA